MCATAAASQVPQVLRGLTQRLGHPSPVPRWVQLTLSSGVGKDELIATAQDITLCFCNAVRVIS